MEKEPDTFQLTEAAGKSAKGKGKKNAEASSKASTPTKDGENAENAAVDEEPKVCLCVDMRARIHAQCCCALRPVLPGGSRRRHCPPAPRRPRASPAPDGVYVAGAHPRSAVTRWCGICAEKCGQEAEGSQGGQEAQDAQCQDGRGGQRRARGEAPARRLLRLLRGEAQ